LLFAEQLKLDDLFAVIGYEQKEINDRVTLKSILNFWMSGSLVQLLGEFELTETEEKHLKEEDGNLRKRLNEEMGYLNSPALGRAVSANEDVGRKAVIVIILAVHSRS
jgi:hypothetical protein